MILAALLVAAIGSPGQTASAPAPKPTQAIVAAPEKAPAVAPDIPLSKDAPVAGAKETGPKDDLTALADGDAPKEIEPRWKSISKERRRLLIMGSSDGFAAAGAAAPCFPGRDAETLDSQLIASGFGDSYAERLPEALSKIAATTSACTDPSDRTYDAGYLMKLPDYDLAVYVTGAVRAYARAKACPSEAQSGAALTAVMVMGTAGPSASPVDALRIGLGEGCAGRPRG